MYGTATLFLFGAMLHSGLAIGPLREPHIISIMVVEITCAIVLSWVAFTVGRPSGDRRKVIIANSTALGGVLLGIATQQALGSSNPGYEYVPGNDFYHGLMVILITASLVAVLFFDRRG